MDVKLVVEKGSPQTRQIRLHNAETIVGRQKGCGLRIPSALVSRRHCRLRIEDDCLTVEDLDSANGCYLNGARIVGKQLVRPGDRLEIGPVRFVIEYALTQTAIDRFLREGAEGSVLRAALMEDEDEPVPVEVVEEEEECLAVELVAEDEECLAVELVEDAAPPKEEEAPVAFDEDGSWRLPVGDDLRDILSKLDDA